MAKKNVVSHAHQSLVHRHDHMHVTHYAHTGAGGIEHMVSNHSHEHNHTVVQHAHAPHENADREHRREAHIHDHAHPSE